MFGRLLDWYTMYTFLGLLVRDGILPSAKFTLRPNLVFSYTGSITSQHSTSGHQPKFETWYKNGIVELLQRAPPTFGWAAITLALAHILVTGSIARSANLPVFSLLRGRF